VVVVGLLLSWGAPWHAAAIAVALLVQVALMRVLLASPREKAPWYNGTGTTLYVLGMLVTAFALRPVVLP
jgi:chlorophyll synthase